MSFQEQIERGDIVQSLRVAVVYGSLWAVGTGWSNAIREVTVTLVPRGDGGKVFGELFAAVVTTFLGVGLGYIVYIRPFRAANNPPPPSEKRTQTRVQTRL